MVGTVWDKLEEFFVILELGLDCVSACQYELVRIRICCYVCVLSLLSFRVIVNADVAVTVFVCCEHSRCPRRCYTFRSPISLQLQLPLSLVVIRVQSSLDRRHSPPPTSIAVARVPIPPMWSCAWWCSPRAAWHRRRSTRSVRCRPACSAAHQPIAASAPAVVGPGHQLRRTNK